MKTLPILFSFTIQWQYPTIFLFVCLAVAIAAAYFHYVGETRFTQWKSYLKPFLAFLRGSAVFLICLLLLSPVLKYFTNETKKPTILVAIDNSESMGLSLSGEDSLKLIKSVESISNILSEKYAVKHVRFGGEVEDSSIINFSAKSTDIGSVMTYMGDVYEDQNPGAIILATDGIFNQGKNPLYMPIAQKIPIYSIALGDSLPKKDLLIKNILHNQIGYLGDKATVELDIAAFNCSGKTTIMHLDHIEGKAITTLKTQNIALNGQTSFQTFKQEIELKKPGLQHFRARLSTVEGEFSVKNNLRDFFIEVLDARQKILILANSPHPDLSAIKSALETNKNYEITIEFAQEIKSKPENFDLIILHQLPSLTNEIKTQLSAIRTAGKPIFVFLGGQTALTNISDLTQGVLSIKSTVRSLNEVQAVPLKEFDLFTLQENTLALMPNFLPVLSPYGEYKVGLNANVLLNQKIGKINTNFPLLVFSTDQNQRVGAFCGEGIWKWRVFNMMQYNGFEAFNDLINRSIQYLTIKEDKRKFRINLTKPIWAENERIQFTAEIYNATFQLTNETDVQLSVFDENNHEFSYTFNKTTKSYSLDLGYLSPGQYKYKARTNLNGQNLVSEGKFSVIAILAETNDLLANHSLLASLAQQSGGKKYGLNNAENIAQDLIKNATLKPLVYENSFTNPAINIKWFFWAILLLLVAEWFLRRFYGAY